MDTYTRLVLKARWPLLIFCVGAVVASLAVLPRLQLDFSIVPLMEASEAERRQVRQIDRALPMALMPVTCVLEWPDRLGMQQLEQLRRFENALAETPGVRRTVSLASVRVVERAEPVPRAMGFDKLAAEESVAEVVGRHPLLQHRLISNDGRAAAVVVEGIESKANFAALEQRARATVPPEARLRIIGVPPVERAMHQTMVGDMMRCVGLESLVYLILLPLFFRTIRGVVIPMAVVLSGLAIYFGLMVALGWSVSIIETAIPGLIVIIGLCDAVHMLHRFEEERPNCADRTEAVAAMMRGVGVACLYTSWTTALGFLSLLIAPHAAVRDFAVSASVGIAAAWVSVMLLMPVLLAVWPMKMTGPVRTRRWSLPMFGRPRLTLAVFVLLAAVSVAGTLRVVVDSHWLEELPRRNEAVQNLRWFEERFGGLLTIDVVIEGDLADPQAIAAYEQLAERILAQPGVSHHDAYTQWVRELTARGSEASAAQLSRAVGAMRWLGNLFPAHLITPAMDRGRIRFYTLDFGTNRYFQIKSLIEREAAQLPDGLAARVGGFGLMAHRSSRLVVTTMMRSFGLSAVVITLFVALAYRSWRIGLMALVPNVLPILVALGLTGWLGIELRIGIVMIYCIGIGLAVDDSIHIFSRYVQLKRQRPEWTPEQRLRRTVRTTGSALLISSVVLTVGSLCYLMADFRSLRELGLLLSAIVVTALVADLYLLPLLIRWLGPGPVSPDQTKEAAPRSGPSASGPPDP